MKNNTSNRKKLMASGIDGMSLINIKAADLSSLEKVDQSAFKLKGSKLLKMSNGIKIQLDESSGIYRRKLESEKMVELIGSSYIYGRFQALLENGLEVVDCDNLQACEELTIKHGNKTLTGSVLLESEYLVLLAIGKTVKAFETRKNAHNAHRFASIIKRDSIK